MKKSMFLLSLFFLISSCTEDIKFNNPAFQTLKDNVFWRAQNYRAYIGEYGGITIEGSLGYENVILQTPFAVEKTYLLGIDNNSKAYYSNTNPIQPLEFSTGQNFGNGQIVITEYNSENNTISGTFKFNAINQDESNTQNPKVNFTEGVFYKIPIQPSEITNDL